MKEVTSSSPPPALPAAAVGDSLPQTTALVSDITLKQGDDSISNKFSDVGGIYTHSKGQHVLQATLAALKYITALNTSSFLDMRLMTERFG